MARNAPTPLDIFLNGRHVGRLTKERSGAIDFKYQQGWLEWDEAIPVSLSLSLREDRYVGDPVIAVFDNLLPDSDPIRRRLAERTGANGLDAYSLLAAIGRDCVGALQFLPEGEVPLAPNDIRTRQVTDAQVADILRGLAQNPLGIGPNDDFRISLAGVQEKTALLKQDGRWHLPLSTTPTTHILKPQIGKLPSGVDFSQSVENEFLCLKLVKALGLATAETEILDFEDRRVLAVERFDRLWTKDGRLLRIPQEDLCQALSMPPSRKYEADGGPGVREIALLLKGSDTPETDQSTVFKAQIVFWLLGATDGHAKNFSVRLASAKRFTLTPLYDVVSAQPSFDAKQVRKRDMKAAMSIGKSRHYHLEHMTREHFVQTGALAEIPTKIVKDTIEQLLDEGAATIEKTIAQLPNDFPEQLAECLARNAKERLKTLGRT